MMLYRTPCAIVSMVVSLSLLSPGLAVAAAVTFEFTGEVTSVTDNGSVPGVANGNQFVGRYAFDGDTPQVPDAPGVGVYDGAMRFWARVDLLGGPFLAVTPPNHFVNLTRIRTSDRAINTSEDESYRAAMENLVAGGTTGDLNAFAVEFRSPMDTPEIDGTALPLIAPDPNAFATAQMEILFPDGSRVLADVLTLPEPTATIGLLAALLALATRDPRRGPS